jgi:hypothetical protein
MAYRTPLSAQGRKLNPDEQRVVNATEKYFGRPLTEQEINLALEQARAIGEIGSGDEGPATPCR